MSPTKATSTTTTTTNPLSERSPNTSSSPTKSHSPGKAAKNQKGGMDERQMPRFELNTNTTLGHHSHAHGASSTTYISPSDAIRSPTTKKLSEIKGKRFQNAKPQTLFAKTLAMQGLKAQQEKHGDSVGGRVV